MTDDEARELLRRHPELQIMIESLRSVGITANEINRMVEEQRESFAMMSAGRLQLPPPVDPYARWREVILPPVVGLILGKRGSGKTALGYWLLELFSYRLTWLVPRLKLRGFCRTLSDWCPPSRTYPLTASPW